MPIPTKAIMSGTWVRLRLSFGRVYRRVADGLSGELSVGFGSLALGISLFVVLWAGIAAKYLQDRSSDRADSERNLRNISLLLGETFERTIEDIDRSVRSLRRTVELSKEPRDYRTIIESIYFGHEVTVQMAVIDAHGIMLTSSADPKSTKRVDLSDRDHFKFHLNNAGDDLFISKPIIGRASGKISVQLTRRFLNADKSFGGVIVASLDPDHFQGISKRVDLGLGAAYALIGNDGVVRARGGDVVERKVNGDDVVDGALMAHIQARHNGSFWSQAPDSNDQRLVWVQNVRSRPFAVSVSVPEPNVFAVSVRHLQFNAATGVLLSLLIGIVSHRARKSEIELRRNADRLRVTLDHMTQGIMMVDKERHIHVINRKCIELLDLPQEFASDRPKFDQLVRIQEERGEFSNANLPVNKSALDVFGPDSASGHFEMYERERPNGTILEVRSTTLPDGGFVRTFSDITRRRQAQAQADRLAAVDTLTSLANRHAWSATLNALTTSPSRPPAFAIFYLDLDRFKIVNDTQGHAVGDRLLQEVADRLRASLRGTDTIARIGGDEFAILLDASRGIEGLEVVAERLVETLSRPYDIEGRQILISASIGIAVSPQDGNAVNELQIAADLALYAAKAAGRSTHRFFASRMIEEVRARQQIETDLRQAVDEGQLELRYQPIINLERQAIVGFEALVRWNHPVHGFIPPSAFIPIAEDSGLILQLGRWVLREACLRAVAWPDEIGIAVNLSPLQFLEPGLLETVMQILDETGLAPARLELEITEGVLLRNTSDTLTTLHRLKAIGVRIAMDDFGTGYSSLSYLQKFPFDRLKIDRSFVSRLGVDDDSAAVIQAIVTIAESRNMQTTAEGVETEGQLSELEKIGCNDVQGYLFSRPMAIDQVPAAIAEWATSGRIAA